MTTFSRTCKSFKGLVTCWRLFLPGCRGVSFTTTDATATIDDDVFNVGPWQVKDIVEEVVEIDAEQKVVSRSAE